MIALDARERRHTPRAMLDRRHDLFIWQPIGYVHQRRKGRRRAGPVDSVTHGALALIERLAGTMCTAWGDCSRPHHLRFVDVNHTVHGIDRRTTPLRTAVESREYHCLLSYREGVELSAISEALQGLQRPFMRRRRSRCEHVFIEFLAGVWLRQIGLRLRRCCDFTGYIALRISMLVN